MNVAAVIVTRGDVDLEPVLTSLPDEWERVLWNNGAKKVWDCRPNKTMLVEEAPDLSVYGRYAAIEYAEADVIYVQDDDCVVSDPQAIVSRWHDALGREWDHTLIPGVVCNMPPEFRHEFYTDHALVGFGACFHRDAPGRAFGKLIASADRYVLANDPWFLRTCDVVFTALTPRVLMDVPRTDLPWQAADNRMWKQPTHMEERKRMLELVKQVRDDR